MRINNICIAGTIVHTSKNFEWRRPTNIRFYDNTIVVKKESFQFTLTRNIREVLELRNLKNCIRKRLELEFHRPIRRIFLKISNIHESLKIRYTDREIISHFLPTLKKDFDISEVNVTQEQNSPVPVSIETLLRTNDYNHFTFLCITVKLLKKSASLKMQVDRQRQGMHLTLIISKFTSRTPHLIQYLQTLSMEKSVPTAKNFNENFEMK